MDTDELKYPLRSTSKNRIASLFSRIFCNVQWHIIVKYFIYLVKNDPEWGLSKLFLYAKKYKHPSFHCYFLCCSRLQGKFMDRSPDAAGGATVEAISRWSWKPSKRRHAFWVEKSPRYSSFCFIKRTCTFHNSDIINHMKITENLTIYIFFFFELNSYFCNS